MELGLQKLLRGTDYPVEGSERYDFSDRDFSQFTARGPVLLTYHAQHETGGVQLTVRIEAAIAASCARCLEEVERDWRVDKTYHITAADIAEEFPELPFTPSGGIDLAELAYGELVLEVDPVILCREDCPGLCPICGHPKTQCECAQDPTPAGDERLAVLRQLLDDDKP